LKFILFRPDIPATQLKLKYINQMFGVQMLMTNPEEATTEPATVTTRHPNLFVRTLTIGPIKQIIVSSD